MAPNLSLKSILKKQQAGSDGTRETPPVAVAKEDATSWIVQDRIQERPKKSHKTKQKIVGPPPTHSNVEGYVPSVRFQPTTSSQNLPRQKDHGESNNPNDEPLVFSSLSQMMETAGTTLPNDTNDDPKIVEAELQFRVMHLDDYHDYKRNHEQQHAEEEIVHTHAVDPSSDTENSNPDEEDFWGVFGASDDDESEGSGIPPRAFLKLWEMLSQWVTPAATAWLLYGDSPVPAKSDIEMARCAALMNRLRLHLSSDVFKSDRERLGELLRRFDYRYAMPEMTGGMTQALADILMASLISDNNVTKVPDACAAVGLSLEEYQYLVRSGIRNFHHHDDAEQ